MATDEGKKHVNTLEVVISYDLLIRTVVPSMASTPQRGGGELNFKGAIQ